MSRRCGLFIYFFNFNLFDSVTEGEGREKRITHLLESGFICFTHLLVVSHHLETRMLKGLLFCLHQLHGLENAQSDSHGEPVFL